MHTLHGRLLPVTMGVKLANPELTVIGTGGDVNRYGIGNFTTAARRNLDMTYIVMNNQIYGLFNQDETPKGTTNRTPPSHAGTTFVKAVKPRNVTKLIEAVR